MEAAITEEERAELDALLILRTGLISEKARLLSMGLPDAQINARLAEVNRLIKPLNVKLGHQRNREEHQARVTGDTFSQLMKMCSLVAGLVRRGIELTPPELERWATIARLINHTKSVRWLDENGHHAQ